MNCAPWKVKFGLKRTLDYDEDEAEPPATRARIDDNNQEEDAENQEEDDKNREEDDEVETRTGDVIRECGGSEMETD